MDIRNKGEIYYVCFYAEQEIADKLVSYPSVWSKIDYIVSTLKRSGKKVTIVSIAQSVQGTFRGFCKNIDENERHHYFSSRDFENGLLKKFSYILQWIKILYYLLNNVQKNDQVIVYHSLYNRWWLRIYRILFRKHFILEIEDVFSSLSKTATSFKKQEWNLFQLADECICVNDIIASQLENTKHKLISYGSYGLPEKYTVHKHTGIKLVYAGVIEQVRNAAFLAVKTMQYLPIEYELHILGFGNDDDLSCLKKLIQTVNHTRGNEAIFYHGKMAGRSYNEFLQNCDIGLSTHMYDFESMTSADHTFPSKILVYMANGLHVVAQKLACLEQSQIGKYLTFYNIPSAESVAKSIRSIDLEINYSGREVIEKMNIEFTNAMLKLIREK